jgi:hypothetical protein
LCGGAFSTAGRLALLAPGRWGLGHGFRALGLGRLALGLGRQALGFGRLRLGRGLGLGLGNGPRDIVRSGSRGGRGGGGSLGHRDVHARVGRDALLCERAAS